jgi:hypothetical protein
MPAEAIRYTTQGDYACSYCGYAIPVNNKNELREWCSADYAGLFCSKSHAMAAGNNLNYINKWSFKRS